jgi:hypothetical protein
MSEFRKSLVAAGAIVALMLMVMALLLGAPAQPAAADTVPTPISAQAGSGSSSYLNVVFWSADTLSASAASSAMQLPGYDSLDLQYVIDQPTTVNTTTIKVQWSNDNSNWSDGPTIVSSNAADADSMVQLANMGRYTRLYATQTGTSAVTITVKAVAKP